MRQILALVLVSLCLAGFASGGALSASQQGVTSAPTAATPFVAPGGLAAAPSATRASWSASPRDYCATCGDGNSHSVADVLGVYSLAGLATTTASDGSTPFAFVAAYPFGVLFNLVPEQPAESSAMTLTFQTTAKIGIQVPASATTAGTTSLVVPDLFVTSDQTAIVSGTPLAGAGIAKGATLSGAPRGAAGNWRLNLSAATIAAIANDAYIIAYVSPAAGTHTIPIIWTSGVNVGDLVTDTGGCIPSGAQVDFVNVAKGEIRLSRATTKACPAQDTLTFKPSWLSKVSLGMSVQGPTGAVVGGTTVAGVNLSTGTVTLSRALTGAIESNSELLGNLRPTTAQQVTFYRPFTDAEAASLEMDGLALQAAINRVAAFPSGGSVDLPTGSQWRLSAPLTLPIVGWLPNSVVQAVSLGGPYGSDNGAFLLPAADFGPDSAALSCGDPTAKLSNARGLYAGGGEFCFNHLHNVAIEPATGYQFNMGLRPTWNGVPVAMDGVKQGSRLDWDHVLVQGFRMGAQAVMDHTRLQDSSLTNNFCGLRMDDNQPNLWGDDVLDRLYISSSSEAALCISSAAFFNGEIRKGYMSTAPYAIYCEPGINAGQCLQGSTFTNISAENLGCGFIQDGGIQDGWAAKGGLRAITDLREINDFHNNGVRGWTSAMPAGGCQWHAYYDVAYVAGVVIENVWTNDYAVAANAFAHILRATRLDGWGAYGNGGWTMRGDGVATAIQNAVSAGQDMFTGPNGFDGAFWWTGAWRYLTLEGPTFKARPMPFSDSRADALPAGSLVEWGGPPVDNLPAVQRAGQTSGAAFAGVSLQNWTSNPLKSRHAPIIAFAGDNVPILAAAAVSPGQYAVPSLTNFGSAVAVMSAYGSPPAAAMFWSAGTAGVNYGQLLQGRP